MFPLTLLSRAVQRCAYKEQALYLPAKNQAPGDGEIAMVREDFVTKKPPSELEEKLDESFLPALECRSPPSAQGAAFSTA